MKITALTNNTMVNQQLANYTLSLFEQTKTEVIDIATLKTGDLKIKIMESNLVVLIISEKYNWLNEEVLSSLKNKPILLQTIYFDKDKNTLLISKTKEVLEDQNCAIWGTYSLLNSEDVFSPSQDITHVPFRLNLIRMINSIMFYNLGIRDNNKFSCGITPPKYYVGDSIGY